MAEIWLTAEEIKKREERLEYLKGPRRLEIAELLKKNKSLLPETDEDDEGEVDFDGADEVDFFD